MNVEARLVIDGVARATNQAQNEISNYPLPWLMFDVLPPGLHHIAVELRDLVASGEIENLHVVAFRAPVIQFAETVASKQVMSANLDVLVLNADIAIAGDYLVFAATSASEGPGSSGITVGLRDPSGSIWPDGEFSSHRNTWSSVVWARRVSLQAGGNTFAIYARSGGVATLRDTRIAIVPAVAVGSQHAENLPVTFATSAGPTTLATLSTPTLAQPTDRVIIQAITAEGELEATNANPVVSELRRDGAASAHYENWNLRTPTVPSGFVDAFVAREAMTLENTVIVADPARGVGEGEAVIHVLDLPCP